MPGKNQVYGSDFRSLSVMLPVEEHRRIKVKAAELGVSVSEVVRLALADEAIWRRAVKAKGGKPA